MKRSSFCILLLLLFSVMSFSQQNNPSPGIINQDYLKKSKNQKTAAWVLTGAGTMGLVITSLVDATQKAGAVIITIASLGTVPQPTYKSYTTAYLISSAIVVSGISLFFIAAKNKKKAISLSFRNEPVQNPVKDNLVIYSVPSVIFKLRL